jgi:hypothetical protein
VSGSTGAAAAETRRESGFGRERLAELDDFVQRISEIFNARQGNNDGIAATIDLFNNPEKTASRILSEIKRDVFPLDRDTTV